MNKIANISSDASCNEIGRIGGNIPACLLKNIDSFKHYKFFSDGSEFQVLQTNTYLSLCLKVMT